MLALPLGDNEGKAVLSSFTLHPEYYRKVEPAGFYFEELVRRKLNADIPSDFVLDGENDDEKIEEETEEYWWEKEYREKSGKENLIFTNKESDNYYAILGIEDLFLNATADDIRKAYKRVALIYHPDKNQENLSLTKDDNEAENSEEAGISSDKNKIFKKEKAEENKDNGNNINQDGEGEKKLTDEEKKKMEINNKWLKIKDAYDTLLDEEKRKRYDSTFEFDERIPEDEEVNEKKFFMEYGPVFMKNAIWSKKKPIPKLGDLNTPIEKVKRFYKFWYNFNSWRDFSTEGEYNLDEASSRYEKRQMLKENKKMKSSRVKEEKARLTTLVSLAYKWDPRIREEEEKIRVAREKEKQEFLAQKQLEKQLEEERLKEYKRQQEENLKKQQEMLAREKEEMIKNLINLGENLGINLSKDDIFQVNLNAKLDNLKNILNENEKFSTKEEKIKSYKSLTCSLLGIKYTDQVSLEESMIWKKDEVIALQKASKKFPVGTKNRWERIGDIVTSKSQNQIIQMAHFLTTNPSIKIDGDIDLYQILYKSKKSTVDAEKAKKAEEEKKQQQQQQETIKESENKEDVWSEEQQKALETALKKHPSSLSANERWTNISKEVPGKTKKQCVDRYKYLAALIKNKK